MWSLRTLVSAMELLRRLPLWVRLPVVVVSSWLLMYWVGLYGIPGTVGGSAAARTSATLFEIGLLVTWYVLARRERSGQ